MAALRRFSIDALRALPVRRRLALLIQVSAGLTLLLCVLAVGGSALWLQQERAREESTEVARTLAFALEAPLAFGDRRGVNDALTLLRARPQVGGAWVYDTGGNLLAANGDGAPLPPGPPGLAFALDHLRVDQAVLAEGGPVGRLVIVNRLSRLWQSLGIAMVAIALAGLAALLVSVRLARRIAATITGPIETLAATTREIARSHDYAQRLPAAGADEIGTATAAFNEMLDEIRQRGETLLEANRVLEQRVHERTQSLQREKERAEAASVAKTRFLANMSHELRTPLNAVIGAAQLLQDGRDDAQGQERLIGAIRDSSLNLLGLIDNILDLARIETGALELAPEDFNLVDCLESAIATAAVGARIKGLELACIVDPRLALWRHGDPLRLRQVLLNILGNAVKFTLEGEVVLHAEPGDAPDVLRLSISDTGIGIGAASLAQVFEPFRQADDGANRRFGGSGLGLAIARQLVEAMGGRIAVASELGRGTRFDIELVLPGARLPRPEAPPLGHEVLYFEPREASARALEAHLERLGCRAWRCRSARELRDWMNRPGAASRRPWLLAAVDAEETWAFLENATAWLDPARVIGMAASESQRTDAARQRFKVPRGLIKPVLRSALVSRLGADRHDALRAAVRPLPALAPAPEPPRGARHVLVVEDDPTNQMIVCGMLQHAGYRTSVAADGAQALALLGRQSVDVVLMDWQMPDLDGLEVTRRLRAGEAGRFAKVVPIVALTANAFREDRIACLNAGMNDFLTKPVLRASLIATIERWTHRPGGDEDSERSSAFAPLL